MFTGIVEEVGQVRALRVAGDSAHLDVVGSAVLQGTRVGDSILTDGVCLTVTAIGEGWFRADAMPETVRRTTLGDLGPGSLVNLERSLSLESRLGGHIVTGHVDGVGTVVAVTPEGIATWLHIETPAEVAQLCVARGSIAVAGVSLTVVSVEAGTVCVSLIPRTAADTTLGRLQPGRRVNVEADVLARYVHAFVSGGQSSTGVSSGGLTWQDLADAGFH